MKPIRAWAVVNHDKDAYSVYLSRREAEAYSEFLRTLPNLNPHIVELVERPKGSRKRPALQKRRK